MKIVVFGLSISSSWGNGHATLWRGLCRGLAERGHKVVFFERDEPWYANSRDLHEIEGGTLIFYESWSTIHRLAERHLADADIGMVTSFCPDGISATRMVLSSGAALRVFYDLDTGVTLDNIRSGTVPAYIGSNGLRDFDLVLSHTGGAALQELREVLGARRVAPLYGSADPLVHRPAPYEPRYGANLSYLATYAPDRQAAVERMFLEPARVRPGHRFLLAGSQYPSTYPWLSNIRYISHVPPADHASLYCSASLNLSVTRAAMAHYGYCPSGRLFEAAACGAPVLSDNWEGIETFFEPGREILLAESTEEVLGLLSAPPETWARIGRQARERVLSEHTAAHRAAQMETAFEQVLQGREESTICGA